MFVFQYCVNNYKYRVILKSQTSILFICIDSVKKQSKAILGGLYVNCETSGREGPVHIFCRALGRLLVRHWLLIFRLNKVPVKFLLQFFFYFTVDVLLTFNFHLYTFLISNKGITYCLINILYKAVLLAVFINSIVQFIRDM